MLLLLIRGLENRTKSSLCGVRTAGHEYWRALSKAPSKDCEQMSLGEWREVNKASNKVIARYTPKLKSGYSKHQKDFDFQHQIESNRCASLSHNANTHQGMKQVYSF